MGRKPKDGFISACRSRQIARAKLEKVLGYDLPKFIIVVHHKDGNPFNNDLENLGVMYRKDHSKLHTDQYRQWEREHPLEKLSVELEEAVRNLNNLLN